MNENTKIINNLDKLFKMRLHLMFMFLLIMRVVLGYTCSTKTACPYIYGGTKGSTNFTAFDMDSDGNIAVGGNTTDSDILSGTSLTLSPFLVYYYANG